MISLVMLPILFTMYLNQREAKRKQQVCMEVAWNGATYGHPWALEDVPYTMPQRNWLHLQFTNDQEANQTKLAFSKLHILNILNDRRSKDGVHFIMDKTASYGTFVSVLNMLLKENITKYRLQDDGIWVTNFPPPPPQVLDSKTTPICGGYYNISIVPEHSALSNEARKLIAHHAGALSIPGILLSLLGILTIYKRY